MCGTQLGAVVVAEEVRKTVTVVFSDLKGPPLAERLDAKTLPEIFNHYFNTMRVVLSAEGPLGTTPGSSTELLDFDPVISSRLMTRA
jgi:hypothetical protein